MSESSNPSLDHSPTNSKGAQAMLIGSRALSAARPAIIALLITTGAEISGEAREPISFCNVLFVGNLCAALLVASWFGIGRITAEFRQMTPRVQAGLAITGFLATFLSALIFLGLQETTVTNAVLLGRLGPVFFAIVGTILLGKKIRRLEWIGFSLIAVGAVAIAFKTSNYQINKGDLFIILSAVVFAISALVNQMMIRGAATLSTIVFSRNLISAVVFFVFAIRFYGPNHFADAFSPQLWALMSIYALIVIVSAQFLWYAAFNKLDSRTVGRLTVISPVFGVIYAFLINGEQPSSVQVSTLGLVTVGALLTSFGKKPKHDMETDIVNKESENVAM